MLICAKGKIFVEKGAGRLLKLYLKTAKPLTQEVRSVVGLIF